MFVKGSTAVIAGVASFVAGMVVGVLVAPASGERTRRRLLHAGEALAAKAMGVKESAEDLVARARRRIA